MSDIVTGTPAALTYDHWLVRQAWTVSWVIVSGSLAIILGWMGLTLIVQEHLGRPTLGWREAVPRLVLGIVASASSLWWCALVIDIADGVSGFVSATLDVSIGSLVRANAATLMTAAEVGTVGVALLVAILYLIYCFFVLYVVVQLVIRLALIDLLLALAPVGLGLWILPATAGWGRHWLRLFMTAVFQQAVQLVALGLAFGFLDEFAGIATFEPVQDLVWKLLLSMAFVFLATRVPSTMSGHGTFDAWLSTLHFGLNLPGTVLRSARTVGMIAGGIGGGPAAAAGAASAASAASAARGAASFAAGATGPAPGATARGPETRTKGE